MTMYTRRTAIFTLMDDKGRVLLQHRSKDATRKPDFWGFFGGEIEMGETPEEAVKREAKEELGIELKNLKFFKRYDFHDEGVSEIFVFVAPLTYSIELLKKQQKEGQDLGLFSSEDSTNLNLTPHSKIVFKDLLNTKW